MDSESRLLNESADRLLTQIFADATFFSFEDIVAQPLAEIFHSLILPITDLGGEGIIKIRKMFLFDLMENNLVICLFVSQLLISIIGRDNCRKSFCLTSLHTDNMRIHARE